jgi:hypothetical protein
MYAQLNHLQCNVCLHHNLSVHRCINNSNTWNLIFSCIIFSKQCINTSTTYNVMFTYIINLIHTNVSINTHDMTAQVFNFNLYPPHVKSMGENGTYAWRGPILSNVSAEFACFLWLDAGLEIRGPLGVRLVVFGMCVLCMCMCICILVA